MIVLRVHGQQGSILLGGISTAAIVGPWSITNTQRLTATREWRLTTTATRLDTFQIRQRPLCFTAPKPKGFWFWPVHTLTVDPTSKRITATLGPPEQ